MIFSPASLRATGERAGLGMIEAATLVRGARFMYTQSVRMRAGHTSIEGGGAAPLTGKVLRLVMSYVFQGLEWLALLGDPNAGDEILMQFSISGKSA